MRKIFFKILFISVSTLFLVHCDNYEFPESPYPAIETLPAVNISETGVTFQGNITRIGNLPIINHGFVWGKTENVIISGEDNLQLGAAEDIGEFKARVISGLTKGDTYYVKAFVATSDYFVYGEAISFTSKGSTPPTIKTFSPQEGTWGDTVTIRGKYFSPLFNNNKVRFGAFSSKVLSANDSVIECVVPNDIPSKTVPISVSVAGNQSQSTVDFKLISPEIENFSPLVASFNEIITITGSNFSNIKERNIVKFNEQPAEVIESTNKQLKVKVPQEIKVKDNAISVTVNLQTAIASNKFSIAAPLITSLSETMGLIGSVLQINGNNFNPILSENTVFIEGIPVTIFSVTKTAITIYLPQRIYKNRSFPIEVVVAEQKAISQEVFTLQDPWLRRADVPHGPFGRYDAVAFSLNGKGYVGLGSGNVDNKFWQFDPKENTWTEVAPFPGGQRAGATAFTIEDKAYVGLGGGASNEFWRYDPLNNSWSKVANFPYESYQAKGFSVNGKGYVLRKSAKENFWQYDPISDTWNPLPDIDTGGDAYPFYPDAGFVIENRLFVYSADYTTAPNQLWEFDFINNTWVKRSDPEPYDYLINSWTTGFSVNGFGYIRGKISLYKYIPSSNTWITGLDGGPGERQLSIAFVIGKKVYLGTSFSGLIDLWEFDPEYE